GLERDVERMRAGIEDGSERRRVNEVAAGRGRGIELSQRQRLAIDDRSRSGPRNDRSGLRDLDRHTGRGRVITRITRGEADKELRRSAIEDGAGGRFVNERTGYVCRG